MTLWRQFFLTMAGLAILGFTAPQTGGAQGVKGEKPEQAGTSCVAPAKGPLGGGGTPGGGAAAPAMAAPEIRARVGQPAVDFEANALVNGGFKNLRLSDFKGKWVVLCFYPGDFTFV